MVRRIVLLAALLTMVCFGAPLPAFAMTALCTQTEINAGMCVTADVGDDDVTLEIDATQPGTPQVPFSGDDTDTDSDTGTVVDEGCKFPVLDNRCKGFGPGKPVPADPAVPPVEPVTLTDIASFQPFSGSSAMEPNGWMIVGLDTNFYSTASPHVVDGALLGRPASVRFTPIGWRWSYGDGATATLDEPGESWSSLGLVEFSAAPGSHVYRAAGSYVIELSVVFSTEYRFDAGAWIPIGGTLTVPSNRLLASAESASTVLVERDCSVNRAGPGC